MIDILCQNDCRRTEHQYRDCTTDFDGKIGDNSAPWQQTAFGEENKTDIVLEHPAYLPDLNLCDFFLFPTP
jgi:hypothetical protein